MVGDFFTKKNHILAPNSLFFSYTHHPFNQWFVIEAPYKWRFTYDHVMLIYGKAIDEQGKPYYMVKNSWGKSGQYKGIWYMSRDYIALNTTYIFLNRHALPKKLIR